MEHFQQIALKIHPVRLFGLIPDDHDPVDHIAQFIGCAPDNPLGLQRLCLIVDQLPIER
ncbi:hypothetical protein [Pelagivirga sediminicola]|uniref:hypothetical protein n=1 Tax=Pelagivirga sediminicola TaxID=2170575 RepID=UPI0014021092|nr:hypothetical protein [Pelagivirga sediminicola]